MFRPQTVRVEVEGLGARFRLEHWRDQSFIRAQDQLELAQKTAFLNELRKDDVVYEVGAHIGSWTLFLAQRAREVHAFEPEPSNRALLARNVAENGFSNVHLHELALGDRSGPAAFAVHRDERDTRHSLVPTAGGTRTMRVDVLRLDDVPGRLGIARPTALKVDVEGAEGLVVDGAPDTLADPRLRVIYLEIHAWLPETGWTRDQLLRRLREVGFDVHAAWERAHEEQVLLRR